MWCVRIVSVVRKWPKSNPAATHIMPNTAVKNGGFRGNRAFSLPGTEIRGGYFFPRGSPAVQVEWIWDHQQKIATFCEENEHLSVKLKSLAEADAASFSPPWTRKMGKREAAFFLLQYITKYRFLGEQLPHPAQSKGNFSHLSAGDYFGCINESVL